MCVCMCVCLSVYVCLCVCVCTSKYPVGVWCIYLQPVNRPSPGSDISSSIGKVPACESAFFVSTTLREQTCTATWFFFILEPWITEGKPAEAESRRLESYQPSSTRRSVMLPWISQSLSSSFVFRLFRLFCSPLKRALDAPLVVFLFRRRGKGEGGGRKKKKKKNSHPTFPKCFNSPTTILTTTPTTEPGNPLRLFSSSACLSALVSSQSEAGRPPVPDSVPEAKLASYR